MKTISANEILALLETPQALDQIQIKLNCPRHKYGNALQNPVNKTLAALVGTGEVKIKIESFMGQNPTFEKA